MRDTAAVRRLKLLTVEVFARFSSHYQRCNESFLLKAAPKGLSPPAQGCRFGYPGYATDFGFQPQRGCACLRHF